MSGNWSDAIHSEFTLDGGHRRCYEHGLFKDWKGNNILRIVSNGVSGTGTTERQAKMLYILETIFAINRA